MQFSRKSFSNLAALESGEESLAELQGGGPLASFDEEGKESNASLSEAKGKRLVFVSNHLPIKMSRNEVEDCYTFELDEDALLVQAAKEAVPEDMTPIYVGCLSQEIPVDEQDEVAAVLQKQHNCYPVRLVVWRGGWVGGVGTSGAYDDPAPSRPSRPSPLPSPSRPTRRPPLYLTDITPHSSSSSSSYTSAGISGRGAQGELLQKVLQAAAVADDALPDPTRPAVQGAVRRGALVELRAGQHGLREPPGRGAV